MKWTYLIPIIIVLGLSFTIYVQDKKIDKLKNNYSTAVNNLKAEEANNLVYKMTIDELEISKDSINNKLLQTLKELDIKTKKLASLQYQQTIITKVDSIVVKDTIFKDPTFKLDTIIGDQWYNLDLALKYPSTIIVEPTFNNEMTCVLHYRKETIKPPKKFFLWRWFQKKQVVTEVTIINSNPYVQLKENKFIDIIDNK